MQVYAALHWAILPVVEIVYDFILHGIPEYSRYVPGVLRFFEMVANLHRYHLLAYSARSKRLLSCNHLGRSVRMITADISGRSKDKFFTGPCRSSDSRTLIYINRFFTYTYLFAHCEF